MMHTMAEVQTREMLAGGRVKGGIAQAHVEWVRQYHGDHAVEELIASLDETIRTEIETAVGSSWCSFEALVVLDRAIQQRFGRGRSLMRELGRYSAHLNLSTTYRLYRRENVLEFLRRSSLLHAQFQDFGRVECHQLDATACEMRHVAARCYSPIYCASALGYYEQVVIMHGGNDVTADETACACGGADCCVFRLRWS